MGPQSSSNKALALEALPSYAQWCLITLVVAGIASVAYLQDWFQYVFDELLLIVSCVMCTLVITAKNTAVRRMMKRAPAKERDAARNAGLIKPSTAKSSAAANSFRAELPIAKYKADLSIDELHPGDAKKNQLVNKLVNLAKYAQDSSERLDECEKLMRELTSLPDAQAATPPYVYGVLVSAFAKAGKVRQAEYWLNALIDTTKSPPRITCINVLISAYAKRGDLAGAERWLKRMPKIKLEADVVSYNAVISACIGKRDGAKAEEYLNRMLAAGIQPNAVSFSSVINACSKADDKVRTERWLDRMPEDIFFANPSAVCFGTLIGASAKVGRIDMAERWLHRFIQSGLEPNVISFNILIAACAKKGDAHRAEVWYKKMAEVGVEPDVVTHNGMIAAFAKNQDVQRAEEWMDQMTAVGVTANVVSYCALVHICAKVNDVVRAEKWLTRLSNEPKIDDSLPVIRCYNAVIHALSREGRYHAAAGWVDKMIARGCCPTLESFSAPIVRLSKRGQGDVAEQWLERMMKAGVKPDGKTVSFVMRAHLKANSFNAAQALLQRLYAHKLTPNAFVLNRLMQHHQATGDNEALAQCQKSMCLLGGRPTGKSVTHLDNLDDDEEVPEPEFDPF